MSFALVYLLCLGCCANFAQAARIRRYSESQSSNLIQAQRSKHCPSGLLQRDITDGDDVITVCDAPRRPDRPVEDWSSQDMLAVNDSMLSDRGFHEVGKETISWEMKDRRFRLMEQFGSELQAVVQDKEFLKRVALGALLDEEGEPASKELVLKRLTKKVTQTWGEVVVPAMLWSRVVSPHGLVSLLSGVAVEFGITAGWVPIVGWIITGVLTLVQSVAVTVLYKQQERAARKTLEGLVMSATCARHRVGLSPKEAKNMWEKDSFFHHEVTDMCGPHAQSQLLMVIQRANFALRRVLKAIEDYGRCLYPAPYNAYSNRSNQSIIWWRADRVRKISCFHGVHPKLVLLKTGAPGLLTRTLSFIAAYTRKAQMLLAFPLYTEVDGSSLVEELFDVVANNTDEDATDVKSIHDEVAKQSQCQGKQCDDKEIKMVSCMMLIAQHRAFEMTFKRLAKAWNIYGRSYMHDTYYGAMRNAGLGTNAIWPCTAYFFEKDSDLEENGMCRRDLFENEAGFHVTGSVTSMTVERQHIDMSKINDVCTFAKNTDMARGYDSDSESDSGAEDSD